MDADDGLLTIAEVAGFLRVSTVTVYRYITIGELRAVKIGGTLRVRRSDLTAALDRPARRAD